MPIDHRFKQSHKSHAALRACMEVTQKLEHSVLLH